MAPTCLRMPACALGSAAAIIALLAAAGSGPIRNLTIAPEAEIVPLFDGMEAGRLDVRLSVQNANRANVFITNATEKAVNVALPKAAVGVHVLPQPNQGFFGNGNNQTLQGQQGGLNANANQAQGVGGPMGPTGLLNGLGSPPLHRFPASPRNGQISLDSNSLPGSPRFRPARPYNCRCARCACITVGPIRNRVCATNCSAQQSFPAIQP